MQGKTPTPCLPSSIGNYSILSNEVLGKGATGIVYRGTLFPIQECTISPNSMSPSKQSIFPPSETKQPNLYFKMKS